MFRPGYAISTSKSIASRPRRNKARGRRTMFCGWSCRGGAVQSTSATRDPAATSGELFNTKSARSGLSRTGIRTAASHPPRYRWNQTQFRKPMGWTPPDGIAVPKWSCRNTTAKEASVSKISTVGVDLAKSVFQIHGADDRGAVALRKKLRRAQVVSFFSGSPRALWRWRRARARITGLAR
jgi:hypothetical protein